MNFTERLIGLITKPDATMKDIVAEPRVEEALVIVVAYAIVTMIAGYIEISHINLVITGSNVDSGTIKIIMVVFGLGATLVITLLLWPIITAVLHMFSMVFGGAGKFYPAMLTAIGYTYLVKIFSAIVSAILMTQGPIATLEVSENGGTTGSAAAAALTGSLYWVQTIVGLICLLWSCYLGIQAVKHGEKMSMKNAALVVGIPLALYLILTFGLSLLAGLF